MVFRTAYRLTGSAADAEDVLQTVFLRFLRRDPEAIANPESYLRRAAIHASFDLIRERQRRAEAPIEDAPAAAPGSDADLRECLRRAIARLDPRQAEIFTLRFIEGHGNSEIAAMLGISQVYVAVTVHRTRAKLAKEIDKYRQGGQR